jgi:hypothetical protein
MSKLKHVSYHTWIILKNSNIRYLCSDFLFIPEITEIYTTNNFSKISSITKTKEHNVSR